MERENWIKMVSNGKQRRGKTFLLNHLKGVRLTQRQAIGAKCYECDGMGETGKCSIETCALLPFSQFKVKLDKT